MGTVFTRVFHRGKRNKIILVYNAHHKILMESTSLGKYAPLRLELSLCGFKSYKVTGTGISNKIEAKIT